MLDATSRLFGDRNLKELESQKWQCAAAAFYPASGWCHLYDQCDSMEMESTAVNLVPEATKWCKGTLVEEWDCDKVDPDKCQDSYTRSFDGHYFVQCSVTSNGQCLAGGGLCKEK
ncbi:EF-hand domain-containing protein [Durusdinium trenchii]